MLGNTNIYYYNMKSRNIIITQKILLLILFFSICISTFLFLEIDINDELWNFQNIFKMYNGHTIYKDCNVIITPFFFFLGNIFLKIFNPTILTFRIYNIFILFLYFGTIFYIFISLNIKKSTSLLYTILIFINTVSVIIFSANYNTLALAFVFIGIIIYLNFYNKKYYNFLQGFIIFIIFFTKQNTGIYYLIAIILFELYNKKLSKIFFIEQIKIILSFLTLFLISLIFFYFYGNLFNFINYVFGGLLEFSNSNITFASSYSPISICLTIIIVSIIIILKRKKLINTSLNDNFFEKYIFIFIVTLFETLTIYPIINEGHILFVLSLYLILFFYFIDTSIINDLFSNNKYDILINWICIIFILAVLIKIIYNFYSEKTNYTRIKNPKSPFYNICIDTTYKEKIDTMSEYINNKNKLGINVIIISSDSALTMISLNQNNGDFDLVFNGNLGYNGINSLINKIKNSENTEFLIYTNKEDMFWQEPLEIREYIIKNLTKIGEICNYSIYK